MATSGSTSVTVTSWDTLKFNWSRSSYSIENNTSTISWNLQLISTSYGAIQSSASRTWNVTVNGTAYSGSVSVAISNNTTRTLASGTTTIAHNTDGTKTFAYSFSQAFNITFSGSTIGTKSGSGSGTLDTIPRSATITEAPSSFTDETTNLTIKFTNPGNFDLKLKIEAGGDVGLIVRDKVTKTSPYTFVLTEDEKKKLRQKCTKNELSVRFTVATYIDGTESKWSYLDRTMTLVNYMPTLSPTVVSEDTTLTDDPDKIIRNYNTVNVAFNATALKEATISSMKVTCGSKSRTSDGQLQNVDSGTFTFEVIDSRGNKTEVPITKTLIDYIPLTCNLSTSSDLVDGSTVNVSLMVKGKYFSGSFGAVTNSLTIEYRYKTEDGDYSTWFSVTGTPSNGEYTATTTVEGLDYNNTYTFQARATDVVYTSGVTSSEQTVAVSPVFDWSKSDFNFNVPVHGAGGFTYDIPVLASGDCNEILNSGKYYLGISSTNRPIDINGWLEVQAYDDGNYCYQKFITYSGEKYERWRNAGTWGDWRILDPHTLWSGAYYMNQNQIATLSSPISKQPNGIQLVFSAFNPISNTVYEYDFTTHTILKQTVATYYGRPYTFAIFSANFGDVGTKHLLMYDTYIQGTSYNQSSGTNNGITYNNSNWILRAVIGF